MSSNLRPAPFFLTPQIVKSLTSEFSAIAKGVANIELLLTGLSDQCPAPEKPEITRFDPAHEAAANDSDGGEPEDWPDAPLPDHADPDLDRPEPATDRTERDAAIVAAYQAGETRQRIAERFDVSRWTVSHIITLHGARRKAKGPPPNPAIAARNAEIAQAMQDGEPIDIVSERFGLSKANIYKIARAAGGRRIDVKRRADDATRAAVLAAVSAGERVSDLAARLGVTSARIYQITMRAGVSIPKQPRAPKVAKPCATKEKAATSRVQVAIHKDETPPPAIVTAAAAKLREVAADSTTGFYSEAAVKRRAQQAGMVRARADKAAADARLIARRAERAAADAAAVDEFQAALASVRARREAGVEVIAPKRAAPATSGAKLAEAIRRRGLVERTRQVQAAPLVPAPSREECPRCGIPGWKGCDHFLPCEDQPVIPQISDPMDRAEAQQFTLKRRSFTGTRQGIGVLPV